MSRKKPAVISLHQRGCSQYPRFILSDQNLRFWTGEGWGEAGDESKALLYCDINSAGQDISHIMINEHKGLGVKKYQAPVYLELRTDDNVSLEQLKDWLLKVSRLLVDAPKYGNGPVPDSLGLIRIDWNGLKEI